MSGNLYDGLSNRQILDQVAAQNEAAILQRMAAMNGSQFHTLGAIIGGGNVPGTPAATKAASAARKEKSVFNVIATDVKTFVVAHRSILYFCVIALVVDHLLFRGVFKARLQAMLETMISKVEAKVAGTS